VRELLTNYGRIDVIWFDGHWERPLTQWRAKELAAMIRELQPGILINDRLPGEGDYETPEQFVPPKPLPHRWETCMTMNGSWAYNPADGAWKSARSLIHMLCEVASRGGNLLLNIGPTGDGSLPPEIAERLDAHRGVDVARNGQASSARCQAQPWQWYRPFDGGAATACICTC
jgi:alpha-L-fucosidase